MKGKLFLLSLIPLTLSQASAGELSKRIYAYGALYSTYINYSGSK